MYLLCSASDKRCTPSYDIFSTDKPSSRKKSIVTILLPTKTPTTVFVANYHKKNVLYHDMFHLSINLGMKQYPERFLVPTAWDFKYCLRQTL